MAEEKEAFLSRWSRRKRGVESTGISTTEPTPTAEPELSPASPVVPADAASSAEAPAAPLPPLDSICVDTDLSAYLQATVDQGLKRLALKKLFQDPHFHFANMDKLDIYIDDYSIADPLPEGMLEQLKFAQEYIFKDPTKPDTAPEAVVIATAEEAALPGYAAEEPVIETTAPASPETEKCRSPGQDTNLAKD